MNWSFGYFRCLFKAIIYVTKNVVQNDEWQCKQPGSFQYVHSKHYKHEGKYQNFIGEESLILVD